MIEKCERKKKREVEMKLERGERVCLFLSLLGIKENVLCESVIFCCCCKMEVVCSCIYKHSKM
jgi:hypothetical protein